MSSQMDKTLIKNGKAWIKPSQTRHKPGQSFDKVLRLDILVDITPLRDVVGVQRRGETDASAR